jgi:hypothetical protein
MKCRITMLAHPHTWYFVPRTLYLVHCTMNLARLKWLRREAEHKN